MIVSLLELDNDDRQSCQVGDIGLLGAKLVDEK